MKIKKRKVYQKISYANKPNYCFVSVKYKYVLNFFRI